MLHHTVTPKLITTNKEQNVLYIKQYDQKWFLYARNDDERATP
jgi:hypothetical protein